MNVRENFETITREIAETCKQVGRNADEVKLIAVTKYVTDTRVEEAIEAGIIDFAENRPQNYIESYSAGKQSGSGSGDIVLGFEKNNDKYQLQLNLEKL